MAQPLQIDTLAFSKSLKEAGADEKLAEAIVEGISKVDTSDLATKADLKDVANSLRSEIGEVKAEIAETRAANRADIAEVRSDLQIMEQRMTIKLGSMMLVGVGIIIALDKLL